MTMVLGVVFDLQEHGFTSTRSDWIHTLRRIAPANGELRWRHVRFDPLEIRSLILLGNASGEFAAKS
jgi:hypothetical protein